MCGCSKALVGGLLQAADRSASPDSWVSRMDLGTSELHFYNRQRGIKPSAAPTLKLEAFVSPHSPSKPRLTRSTSQPLQPISFLPRSPSSLGLPLSHAGPPAPSSPTSSQDRVLPHPLDPNMHTDPLEALAHNATGHVLYVPSQQEPSGLRAYPGISLPFPVIIYPGSFNPLHEVSHSSHAVLSIL